MAEEPYVLSVMPGDEIVWDVEVRSRSRLRYVWATFIEESEEPSTRLVLGGEVYSFEPSEPGRINEAELLYSETHSDQLIAGDYRLRAMEVVTSQGANISLMPDLLPGAVIWFEEEPDRAILKLMDSTLRVR